MSFVVVSDRFFYVFVIIVLENILGNDNLFGIFKGWFFYYFDDLNIFFFVLWDIEKLGVNGWRYKFVWWLSILLIGEGEL